MPRKKPVPAKSSSSAAKAVKTPKAKAAKSSSARASGTRKGVAGAATAAAREILGSATSATKDVASSAAKAAKDIIAAALDPAVIAAIDDVEVEVEPEADVEVEVDADADSSAAIPVALSTKSAVLPAVPLPPPHPGTPGKRLTKIVELLGKRYEAEGKRAELTELSDPFQLGAWFILGEKAKRNGQARAYDALRRAKGVNPGQLLDIAPEKLATICQIAGPYEDARARDLYNYADEIEEKCGQDFSKVFKTQADARKFLEIDLRRRRDFTEFLLLYGGKFPIFPLDARVTRVAVRLGFGKVKDEKDLNEKDHKELQKALEAEGPKDIAWLKRAHGLFHRHGQELCHATNPNCEQCPAVKECQYVKKHPIQPKDPAVYERRPWGS